MRTKEYMELMSNTNLADKVYDLQCENHQMDETLLAIERFCLKKYGETRDRSWLECKTIADSVVYARFRKQYQHSKEETIEC